MPAKREKNRDVSQEDFHRHKCPDCGHVWQHPDSCAGDDKAHICPGCGREGCRFRCSPTEPLTKGD